MNRREMWATDEVQKRAIDVPVLRHSVSSPRYLRIDLLLGAKESALAGKRRRNRR